ncbi:MAG: hypothetical protein ACE5HK_01220 [Candidatus Methylomirabilales bacterium]
MRPIKWYRRVSWHTWLFIAFTIFWVTLGAMYAAGVLTEAGIESATSRLREVSQSDEFGKFEESVKYFVRHGKWLLLILLILTSRWLHSRSEEDLSAEESSPVGRDRRLSSETRFWIALFLIAGVVFAGSAIWNYLIKPYRECRRLENRFMLTCTFEHSEAFCKRLWAVQRDNICK